MSSISRPVQHVLEARNEALRQQIDTALVKKGLDSTRQTGEAINQLLAQSVEIQRQLAAGHLDVKV